MQLEKRVAIVTGASRGVGRSVALALAREGCDVVVAAKTSDPDPKLPGTIHDTAREVQAMGRRSLAVQVNVRNEAEVEGMVSQTLSAFGRVDVLVNNAGALHWASVADMPPKRFDLVMDVNVRAAFLCTRAVLPAMREQKRGHVVMMSPPISTRKLAGKAPYLLSKMGMTMLALAVAEEEKEHGIGATALWPVTMIESQATLHFGFGSRAQWRSPEILADATVAIVAADAARFSGRALYDEQVLAASGITDFSRYACVPGAQTPPLCREMIE
ncbi:MAG: SDR family oxidoreductase [Deltaproteobacteria bacterium]|nr:SDR family oxidoreductase [Deltaproteobacteria bacterium]